MKDGKHVILCIDDDKDILDSLRIILEKNGYIMVEAESAEEGLKVYKDKSPDFVLVDLMMESIDAGKNFVKELKLLNNKAPIYMLSSVGDSLASNVDFSELGRFYDKVDMDQAKDWAGRWREAAEFVKGPEPEAIDRAGAIYLATLELLKKHNTDTVTMNCLHGFAAGKLLVSRLEELAAAHGFRYNRVFVKNQKTLWGSCSSQDNINLNISLARLPDELRDYVLIHELVHTRHKNHSPAFWREVDAIVGDSKALRRKLRQYRPAV